MDCSPALGVTSPQQGVGSALVLEQMLSLWRRASSLARCRAQDPTRHQPQRRPEGQHRYRTLQAPDTTKPRTKRLQQQHAVSLYLSPTPSTQTGSRPTNINTRHRSARNGRGRCKPTLIMTHTTTTTTATNTTPHTPPTVHHSSSARYPYQSRHTICIP